MQMVLTILIDVERNVVKIERASMRGVGDLESELASRSVESGPDGWVITPEGAAVAAQALAAAAPATEKPPTPGNLMGGPLTPKPANGHALGNLAVDLMSLGLSEDQAANLVKLHSIDRLRKLLSWVRTVQAREGCTNPASLFLKCLAKGVQ